MIREYKDIIPAKKKNNVFFKKDWDSLHARLNKAWGYKKKK